MPVQISFFTTLFLLLSCCGTLRLASTGQHINSTNPELESESHRGTALAGFEPVTICFRDCFKMPRELGGEGGTVLDSGLPLLFCCSAVLFLCFSASLLLCFSAFPASLLVYFSAFLLLCFSVFVFPAFHEG